MDHIVNIDLEQCVSTSDNQKETKNTEQQTSSKSNASLDFAIVVVTPIEDDSIKATNTALSGHEEQNREVKTSNKLSADVKSSVPRLFINSCATLFNRRTVPQDIVGERRYHCQFTYVTALLLIVSFFYMCGDFGLYISKREMAVRDIASGPSLLLHWITMQKESWFLKPDTEAWTLTGEYLIQWGGRYLPLMRDGAGIFRWITSAFVHRNIVHLLGNLVFFGPLSSSMEAKFGWICTSAVYLISHLNSSFASALFERSDIVLIGSSGGICGLLGFKLMDSIQSFRAKKKSVGNIIAHLFCVVVFFASSAVSVEGVSHASHFAGFTIGIVIFWLLNHGSQKRGLLMTITGFVLLLLISTGVLYRIYDVIIPAVSTT